MSDDGYTSVPWIPLADDEPEPADAIDADEEDRLIQEARDARSFNRGVVVGALVMAVTLALCALIL